MKLSKYAQVAKREGTCVHPFVVEESDIDELAEEMVGDMDG